jgi:fatty-acyl-CoA synthase
MILEEEADISEEDVRDFGLERIARYKVPKYVFFVDEFPLTASGKIQKFIMRDQAVELLKRRFAEEEGEN